jgi:quercetin dioxygenase-like cupin family protein
MIAHEREVEGLVLSGDMLKNVLKKVLISPKEGWDGYVMRVFELGSEGYTPKHSHPWPHINYILKGKGILHLDGADHEIEAGSFAYVPKDIVHQFKNQGDETLSFICIVPEEGDL